MAHTWEIGGVDRPTLLVLAQKFSYLSHTWTISVAIKFHHG